MKTTGLTFVFALALGVSSYGQGSVSFANTTATRVCLYPGGFVPVGSTYLAEFSYAPDGTAPGEFDSAAIRLGAATGFGPAPGLFSGGNRTAPTATPGGFGLFQVRVWPSAFGTDYRSVIGSGNPTAVVGASAIVRV